MNNSVLIPREDGELRPTELDARGSTSPDLPKALATAVAAVPPGFPQFLRTRQAPESLLRPLLAKGIEAHAVELPDGSWRTLLRRIGPTGA